MLVQTLLLLGSVWLAVRGFTYAHSSLAEINGSRAQMGSIVMAAVLILGSPALSYFGYDYVLNQQLSRESDQASFDADSNEAMANVAAAMEGESDVPNSDYLAPATAAERAGVSKGAAK